MIKLDENLLQEIGLGAMAPADKTRFLKHIYETLEKRVGTRLANSMTDQQLSEFEQYIAVKDEQGAMQWLEYHFPNYRDVVTDEFNRLKHEIAAIAPDILGHGESGAPQPPRPPRPPQAPQAQPGQPAYDQPSQPPQYQPDYQSQPAQHPQPPHAQ